MLFVGFSLRCSEYICCIATDLSGIASITFSFCLNYLLSKVTVNVDFLLACLLTYLLRRVPQRQCWWIIVGIFCRPDDFFCEKKHQTLKDKMENGNTVFIFYRRLCYEIW